MNKITEKLLEVITDWKGAFNGAFNIREDGECVSRQSSPNVSIEPMAGGLGTEIHVSSKAQGETVYIPACVTKSDVNDLVYNDFYIGAGAEPYKNGVEGEFSANGKENKIPFEVGTLVMARGDDYNSAYGAFFIVTEDTDVKALEGKYAAFGKITDGMDAIEAIIAGLTPDADGKIPEAQQVKITGISEHASHSH
mgnify:CR=1 FL=1